VHQYLDLLKHVLDNGVDHKDRTGVGRRSVIGYQMRFDLSEGFPVLTTKKLHSKSIIHELLWFLKGDTNIAYLKENGVRIWDKWADENGDLGPIYGHQWRSWPTPSGETIDQITRSINLLKADPDSARNIVSSWNVAELSKMALPPCHLLFQFSVLDKKLYTHMYQRSADVFLGVPFNITSYALLTMMVAQVTGLVPGEFIHTLGDTHLYSNHLDLARIQLEREPKKLPRMVLNKRKTNIFDFSYSDFQLIGYEAWPNIKAVIAK